MRNIVIYDKDDDGREPLLIVRQSEDISGPSLRDLIDDVYTNKEDDYTLEDLIEAISKYEDLYEILEVNALEPF